MASERAARGGPLMLRFTATERLAHWLHAAGFTAMLGTGLVLYVPQLHDALGGRPEAKAAHLAAAIAWLTALVLVGLLGNRRALRSTRRDLEFLDLEDRAWLRRQHTPQGRFNAGQKLHSALQGAFAVLFVVSGSLLWAGERVTLVRLPGAIVVHDVAMYLAVLLLLGHLWLSLVWPPTRHAMRGITLGTVRESWARRVHPKWVDAPRRAFPSTRPGRRLLLIGLVALLAGAAAGAYVVHDALGDRSGKDVPLAPSGPEVQANAL